MENFLLDNEDILFHLENMDIDTELLNLEKITLNRQKKFAYAPVDHEDAKDSYKKVLNVIGEICGETLAPLAPEIDEEGR